MTLLRTLGRDATCNCQKLSAEGLYGLFAMLTRPYLDMLGTRHYIKDTIRCSAISMGTIGKLLKASSGCQKCLKKQVPMPTTPHTFITQQVFIPYTYIHSTSAQRACSDA